MPRKIRVEYPGAIYHLMSRGDRKEDIYHNDVDRQDFLKTLGEACQKTGFEVHAYCLMRNHFHLVVETPNANLVAGMRWLSRREWNSAAVKPATTRPRNGNRSSAAGFSGASPSKPSCSKKWSRAWAGT